MTQGTRGRPKVVPHDEWVKARDALLAKEKELTHAKDALAAERRRLPMVRIDKPYTFEAPNEVGAVAVTPFAATPGPGETITTSNWT